MVVNKEFEVGRGYCPTVPIVYDWLDGHHCSETTVPVSNWETPGPSCDTEDFGHQWRMLSR